MEEVETFNVSGKESIAPESCPIEGKLAPVILDFCQKLRLKKVMMKIPFFLFSIFSIFCVSCGELDSKRFTNEISEISLLCGEDAKGTENIELFEVTGIEYQQSDIVMYIDKGNKLEHKSPTSKGCFSLPTPPQKIEFKSTNSIDLENLSIDSKTVELLKSVSGNLHLLHISL